MISNVFVAILPAAAGAALGMFWPGGPGAARARHWRVWALAWAVAAIVAEVSMTLLAGGGAASHVVHGLGGMILPAVAAGVYARSNLP